MSKKYEWGEFKFPQVGQEVNFWIDEETRYAQGVIVYSGEKGATVDIGYLASSGEPGDFAEITKEDRLRNQFVAALHSEECVIGEHRLFKSTAEALFDAIKAGKVPGVKLEVS